MIFLYADPDATGTGDGLSWANAFTSVSSAITPIPELVDDYTIMCRSSSGTADIAIICASKIMNGYTITIKSESGDEALKTGIDVTRYRSGGITNQGSGYIIDGIQVVTSGIGITVNAVGAGVFYVKNSYVESAGTAGLFHGNGLDVNYSSIVTNSIFTGTNYDGVNIQGGSLDFINSISYGATSDGMEFDGLGTMTITNSVSSGGSTDFDIGGLPTVIIDHCMTNSGEGSGTNQQIPSLGSWTNEFVDPANGDFTAVETGNIQYGIGISLDANVPALDIEGDTRSGATAYIGVDEPAGGTTPASPNDIVLSSIILESSTASSVAVPSDLILSSIVLEDTTGNIKINALPSNLVLSAIILESTSATNTAIPNDLVLSAIILEETEGIIVGVANPNDIVLSNIILEETTGRIIGAVVPLDLVLSSIVLGQTRESGGVAIPACVTINMETASITIEMKQAEITINMEVC